MVLMVGGENKDIDVATVSWEGVHKDKEHLPGKESTQ